MKKIIEWRQDKTTKILNKPKASKQITITTKTTQTKKITKTIPKKVLIYFVVLQGIIRRHQEMILQEFELYDTEPSIFCYFNSPFSLDVMTTLFNKFWDNRVVGISFFQQNHNLCSTPSPNCSVTSVTSFWQH